MTDFDDLNIKISLSLIFMSTGLPHYNAIFGVHRNRPCYK